MGVPCTANKRVNIFSKERVRVAEVMLGGMPNAVSGHRLTKLHLLVSSGLIFRLP